MAKHIIATCDACTAEGLEDTTATAYRLTLEAVTREIDLCERHELDLLAPLRKLLDEHGQPVAVEQPRQPASSTPRVACPDCGKQLKTRDSLAKHLKRIHGKMLSELDDGDQAKLIELDIDDADQKPYECPDCHQRFATPQGKGAHRSRAHGYVAGDDKTTTKRGRKSA